MLRRLICNRSQYDICVLPACRDQPEVLVYDVNDCCVHVCIDVVAEHNVCMVDNSGVAPAEREARVGAKSVECARVASHEYL